LDSGQQKESRIVMRYAGCPASAFMQLGGVRGFWRKTAKKTKGRKTTWALGSMFIP
jgi:hypothetical protein